MVAVRRSDGRIECSPFHVKLVQGLRRGDHRSQVINLRVNGELVPVSMKLGPAGEAFFVERTRDGAVRETDSSLPSSPVTSHSLAFPDDAIPDIQLSSVLSAPVINRSPSAEDIRFVWILFITFTVNVIGVDVERLESEVEA